MKSKKVGPRVERGNVKKLGAYIRASTPRQAAIQEGTLKNQQQLLDESVRNRNATADRMAKGLGGEAQRYEIVEYYIEEPRTGTETSRRLEYQRMVEDVKSGRIDTVMCVALSRVSRSVKDFLELIDLLHKHDCDFISLKEDFDSTTPQGKCFMIILLALYQFESEIDSQRVKDSIKARSDRGLWIGGQIIGYDLDDKRPGYLIPNEREAKMVNVAFDQYLALGSIPKVVKMLNDAGFKTKEYKSRRGNVHTGRKFVFTSVANMLKNRAYLGEREIGKGTIGRKPKKGKTHKTQYRIVPGVWLPIVSKEKFEAVQALMGVNEKTGHNGVAEPKHFFLFNGGLLKCDKCGAEMLGASGTSKSKKVYHYYKCVNRQCRFKLPANEVEDLIKARLKHLGQSGRLSKLVEATNARIRAELPKLHAQRDALRKELETIKSLAAGIMARFANVLAGAAEKIVQEQLETLGQRRERVQQGLDTLEQMVKTIERDLVEKAVVQQALTAFDKLFDAAPPYLRKQFVQTLVGQVRVSDLRLAIGLDGRPGAGLRALGKQEPAPGDAQAAGSARYQSGGPDGSKHRTFSPRIQPLSATVRRQASAEV